MDSATRDTANDASVARAGGRETVAVGLLIAATALIRIALGEWFGLTIDESYMVAAGRTLRWGYFDHPPTAWWLSRGAAMLFGSEAPLAVRLPFIALFALSTWLMFRLTSRLFSARAGLWAAAAFNAAPVFGLTSGSWVLPDGPLICALLGAALCLAHALESRRGWAWWVGAGLCAGAALFAKYSAALPLAGAGVYLLTAPQHRAWLGRPQPWVAIAIAAAAFAPAIAWNAAHGWASLAFQGGRVAARGLNPAGPFAVLAGTALFVLPWIWAGLILALLRGLREGPANARIWLLVCLAAPAVVLFPAVALWSRGVLFHWSVPGYLFLFPLLGVSLAQAEASGSSVLRRAVRGTVALLAVFIVLVLIEVRFDLAGRFIPSADLGVQMRDWTALREDLAARGLLARPRTVIAGTSWWVTGKLDYALGGAPPVLCFNLDAREYGFGDTPARHLGEDVLLLGPKLDAARAQADYGRQFVSIEELPPAVVRMSGRPPVLIPMFIGHGLRAWP